MPLKNLNNAIQAAKLRIKYKDIFNLKELYIHTYEWLLEHGWSSVDASGKIEDNEWWESLYLEKIGGRGEKEIWWWWRLQKLPTNNSYYKYHLDLDAHVINLNPTEVVRDGKKLKAHKGEVEVMVWAYLEFDYKGEWSRHPILKIFNQVFPKRIFKKELYESHKLELYREVYLLQDFLKKWFKLKRFLPYEEVAAFHPSAAYPEWKKE